MQIIKKCDKFSEIIFFIAVLIHIAIMCEEFSAYDIPYRGRLLQVAFVLCCVKILMTYYEKIEWIAIAAIGAISVASYMLTKEKYVIYLAVLVISARSTDIKVILLVLFYCVVVSIFVVALLSFAGYGGTVSETRDFGRGIVETRYMLGFSHANNLHGTVWYALALMVILFKDKIDWKVYLIATIGNIALYIFTHSKTGLTVAQLVLVAGFIYRYFNKAIFEKIWIYLAGSVIYVATLILTFISVSVNPWDDYGPVLTKLNDVLTNRIKLSYESAYIGDWNALAYGGSHKDTIDNGFVALAADYGYIIQILFILFVAYLMYRTFKDRDGILFITLITSVFYVFMERSYMINDAYLLSDLIVVVAIIYMSHKKLQDDETEKTGQASM